MEAVNRFLSVILIVLCGCPVQQPQPIPIPPDQKLDGLAERTRLAWAKRAGLTAEGMLGVANRIKSKQLTGSPAILDALEMAANTADESAMKEVAFEFAGKDDDTIAAMLVESAKGVRWHSSTSH